MKGPGLRMTCDVRRIWRCPACGSEMPAAGDVTSLRCPCEKPNRVMQLIEPQRKPRPEPVPLDIYFECAPDDEPDGPVVNEIRDEPAVDEDDSATSVDVAPVPDDDAVDAPRETYPATEPEVVPTEPQTADPAAESAADTTPAKSGESTSTDKSKPPKRGRRRRSRGRRRNRGQRDSDSAGNSGPGSTVGGADS